MRRRSEPHTFDETLSAEKTLNRTSEVRDEVHDNSEGRRCDGKSHGGSG